MIKGGPCYAETSRYFSNGRRGTQGAALHPSWSSTEGRAGRPGAPSAKEQLGLAASGQSSAPVLRQSSK